MSTSGVSRDELDLAIRSRLNASHVEIEDISGGCGQAYEVVIVSPEFAGKRTLQRHKLVNAALKDEIAAVHAFTQVRSRSYSSIRADSVQKDYTPEEYKLAKESE
ncbi:Uncharacterized bolA-like protein C8C9.11 [Taphrina deformans PYCC 5710]|uniref:Uncharacterized bolA-like protein C8C9.11 n=1 Tax=Taphrina deformans (strain PYCC 5710 / ATCC 11124 / CBS 356.35 / IMI 108563 / JCM 9778 / NBRC 8474) TaxID=1097556 RepID=R5A808_TAPDE|nr:Uncharacterized bolA-like protein C8C9.11 [Taphrina deformans PYCC 5710]|eukprot:CCX35424.1 Uncharacterized bolA-like protein C8C9.11 [Taphrina deformans PYCC 5710]